jgi:hypothetical protein
VDETLTVHRLNIFNAYWKDHPPMHLLVASYLGYENKEAASGSFEDLVDRLSGLTNTQGGVG